MNVDKLISLKNTASLLVSRRMSVSQQLQLGRLFREIKFVIFIMFEIRDKTCSKIEKNLVSISSLGGKRQLSEWKKFRSSRPELYCQKGFLKNLQNSLESTCTGVFFASVVFM